MFLSQKIEIKRCQNYTKAYIYEILYKIRSIKQTILKKYSTNMKMTISHRILRISDLLLLKFFIFYFALYRDIIANIIMYSLYSPYYVTRTFTNVSAVSLSRVSVCITWPVYCTAIGGILRLLWDIVIFRLVAYLLNMICLILWILYKILTQFYTNFSRQEH